MRYWGPGAAHADLTTFVLLMSPSVPGTWDSSAHCPILAKGVDTQADHDRGTLTN